MPHEPLPAIDVVLWNRLRAGWRSLPVPERLAYLRAAADYLHGAWRQGENLASFPFGLLAFHRADGRVTARLPELDRDRARRPVPPHSLLEAMAAWLLQVRDTINPRDALYFFNFFMRTESMTREGRRHALATLDTLVDRAVIARAETVYRAHLAEENVTAPSDTLRCEWQPDPSVTPAQLRDALEAVERDPQTASLKDNPIIRVMRANLLGQDALIKRYDLPRRIDRIKYRYRATRARRAWAAGRTLLSLGIPTPAPLGYLEICDGKTPVRSYIVTEFLADAVPAYRWLKVHYRKRAPAWRAQFRQDLLKSLLSLYDRGIYHADTKSPNLMLKNPDDPATRVFYWIDLECVGAGVTPSRHQIVRNLVQLNGSFRHWVPEEDRIAFLHDIARRYPWLNRPRIIGKIRAWTRKRWLNELSKHIGP